MMGIQLVLVLNLHHYVFPRGTVGISKTVMIYPPQPEQPLPPQPDPEPLRAYLIINFKTLYVIYTPSITFKANQIFSPLSVSVQAASNTGIESNSENLSR